MSSVFSPNFPLSCVLVLSLYGVALWAVWQLEERVRERVAIWLVPCAVVGLLLVGGLFSPLERLLFSTVLLLGLLKCTVALRRPRAELRHFSRFGLALYFLLWPGLDMRPFQQCSAEGAPVDSTDESVTSDFYRGVLCLVAGSALLGFVGWCGTSWGFEVATWSAIASFLLIVHFGIGALLPSLLRQLGFAVGPLFRAPENSVSLADFWSRRWNLPFIEMDRLLFLRPLRRHLNWRYALFGVFVVSGLFHELGLSYPARGGWGGPLLYFVLQGALVAWQPAPLRSPGQRVFAWLAIVLPLPLLFHAPFRAALLWPLVQNLSAWLHLRSFDWYLSLALWLGASGHFVILLASFQVPKQLNWTRDFASLSRFNRKIFWTYGAFIVGIIVAFGLLIVTLHDELLRGERSAVAISLLVGAFWTARILTDIFYFGHDDWPRGALFEIGHSALTLLFFALAILFGIVVPLHAWL